jgi:hypothetical protein
MCKCAVGWGGGKKMLTIKPVPAPIPIMTLGTTAATTMMQLSTTDRQQNKLIQKNTQFVTPG